MKKGEHNVGFARPDSLSLWRFFLKAMNCGAISEDEAMETGLSLEEIPSRSFYEILRARRRNP